MDRKLSRAVLLITITAISIYIGGIFITGIAAPSFQNNRVNDSDTDNEDMNNSIPQNASILAAINIQDQCCGHRDFIPPSINLVSPANNSIVLVGTPVNLDITDDNRMIDYKPTEVLYNWDNQDNETLDYPYDVDLPAENGTYLLYVYAYDVENWATAVFNFTVTTVDTDGPTIIAVQPANTSILLGDTTIDLRITDNDPKADFKPTEVLYNWDNQTNMTLSEPYDVVLPSENGTHLLYVYACDDAENWSSAIFVYTVTMNPNETSIVPSPYITTSTTTTNTNATGGDILTVFAVLSILSLTVVIRKHRR
ncbi:MAG: hypothetical protein ACFFD4_10130 [Candidatus Odinarchaeota archaeon]